MTTAYRPIAEIQAELDAALAAEADARKAAADKVTPKMQFTLSIVTDRFDRTFDESVIRYRLEGVCLNADEVQAVGKRLQTGGMTYLFNRATGKVIMKTGGGTMWLPYSGDEELAAVEALNKFIWNNAEGGDCTELVESFRKDK